MENSFITKVLEAFRDQPLTPEVALRINELHWLEMEKVRNELIQSINKAFE